MTIAEVLAPCDVAEDDFAAGLARDLRTMPDAAASGLTEQQERMLGEYGGIAVTRHEDARSTDRAMLRVSSSNLPAWQRVCRQLDVRPDA